MSFPSFDRLEVLLCAIRNARVLLIGDLCLDAYWYADMTRSELSRETPRFPLPIVAETYSPGGAANVAANLAALGVGRVQAIGVLGQDWRGDILMRELTACGIDIAAVIRSPQRTTPTYIKPIRRGYGGVQQEDSRLDFQDFTPLPANLEDAVIEALRHAVPDVDAVVIGDQLDPGVVTPRVRSALIELAAAEPRRPFVVDSRKHIADFRAMILKPNELELAQAIAPSRLGPLDRAELAVMGQALARLAGRPCFVTLGADGALLCREDGVTHLPAAPVRPPLDIVGAGDTFLAALGAALAARATLEEAGSLGNLAAAVVVEKLNQTGTASPDEVRERLTLARQAEVAS
ncbi:MAG: PfkB family carbohydrate kinase [Anaerolineae bacterium]|nr:PfkB family carbohydrate kinase [Anaerolineae bacterium]MDW8099456.1 PfkB family carbohydrate kinase [Anaerolineae bacterium]